MISYNRRPTKKKKKIDQQKLITGCDRVFWLITELLYVIIAYLVNSCNS